VRVPGSDEFRCERLRAELSFDYDGVIIRDGSEAARMVFEPQRRRLMVRDESAERLAADRLRAIGLREAMDYSRGGPEFWFNQRHLPRVIRTLVAEGWHVEADGRLYRRSEQMRLRVSSGIDWFELQGEVDFAGRSASLPELLAAIRRGDSTV